MDELYLEYGLQRLDFSFLSQVRQTLLEELLYLHRRQKMLRNNNFLHGKLISDQELDEVAAAGNNVFAKDNEINRKIFFRLPK